MIFRFTLTDEGNNSKVISEPSGWQNAQLGFERSDWFSLVEVFESTFLTYGANSKIDGGRDWIKNVETTYGIDSNLAVLVEGDYLENGNWETVYKGILPIQMFVESLDISGNLLQIVFSGPDFWSYWKARYATQVDVRGTQTVSEQAQLLTGTVTPTPYINLPLPSQKIIKKYEGVQKFNKVIDMYDLTNSKVFQYCLVDLDTDILSEVLTKFAPGFNPTEEYSPFSVFTVADSGDFDIDLSITLALPSNARDGAGPSAGGNYFFDTTPYVSNRTLSSITELDVYVQVNSQTPIKCTSTDRATSGGFFMNNGLFIPEYTSLVTDYTLVQTIKGLKKNDQIKIYINKTAAFKIRTYDSGSSSGILRYPIIVFGNQGYSNSDFCFLASGFLNNLNSSNVNIYSQLIEQAYLSTGTQYAPDVNGLPTINDIILPSVALQQGDTFIVGQANVIGGIQTEIGWILQFLGHADASVGSPPTMTTTLGSPVVNFSNANLFGFYTILFDTSGRLIGAIKTWNTTTQATLTQNALHVVTGAAIKSGACWWISQVPLMQGQQPYGRTHLNVIFNTTSDDAATGLFQAAGTNAYTLTDPNITGPLEEGESIYVQFANNNTGASTLNINGGGAVPIINLDGSPLVANDIISTLIAAGTNTYTLAAYAGLTQLIEGLILVVKFTNANTGASTLNVNSLGAIAIYTKIGVAGAGQIPAGSVLALVYDGTNFVITDTDQTVSGQIYVLNYDGGSFVLTPISNTEGITPTATKTAQAFLAHDVAAGICDRITEVSGLFYSDYFGNPWTSIPHAAIGCGSNTAILKGLHVRGYTLPQKPFFSSMQDWYEGAHPIHCIGIGYETVNGHDAIVCEPIDHFFDASSMSILLSNVQNIKRYADNDNIFNQIQIGFSKWESQAASGTGSPSGLDDPQSQRNLLTRFKFVGKLITILSGWVGASLTLETTRRIGNLLSANYTYDNDTFVVALKSNGDGTFTPELNENFSSITNLNNSETRYNSRITPMRNFLRWIDYLSGCLQDYLSSRFSFTSGTGNYNMASTMSSGCPGDDTGVNVAENGNFPVSTTPLFIPKLFEIEHDLNWNDYKIMRANKNKAIGISQTNTGHVPFFIKSCRYQIAKGTFKITAWCKQPFNIQIIESTLSHRRHGDEYGPDYD